MKPLIRAALAALFISPAGATAEPTPSLQELRDSAGYAHNKTWLANFPSSFVATNIRGEGMQYAERRLAALDLVRQQRDFGNVSELMTTLERGGFLSEEIIGVLEDWKAKRALPLLEKIQKEPSRPVAVRERAAAALASIRAFKPEAPPKF